MSIRIGEQIISGGVPTSRTEALVNQNEGSTLENVYNWVGTTQEYEEQEVALLHPEWVCYITDDETHDDQEIEIIAYTARNVGDIFFTSRSDEWLNGAVECNGQTYSLADYSGDESINALLQADKIPYVSISDYEAAITAKGWCDKFGWDGVEASTFKVPTLTAKIIQENNLPVIGNGMTLGITDGTNNAGLASGVNTQYGGLAIAEDYGVSVGTTSTGQTWVGGDITMGITTDATKSGMIADLSNDSANLRVMVQLSTGFNDESVETLHTLDTEVTTLVNEVETIAASYVPNTSLTNCITKIPQNIKLDLDNNNIILRAGSKVYVPNGFEEDGTTRKFDEVVITTDLTTTFDNSVPKMLFVATQSPELRHCNKANQQVSSATAPSLEWGYWYDLTENIIKFTNDNGSTWQTNGYSLPVGLASGDNNAVFSIDKVFNGFGYMGTIGYVLPGIEYLFPNGRKSDGTYNNLVITTSELSTVDFIGYASQTALFNLNRDGKIDHHAKVGFHIDSYPTPVSGNSELVYDSAQNKYFQYSNATNLIYAQAKDMVIGTLTVNSDGTTIERFDINGCFAEIKKYSIPELVEVRQPRASNNYTWCRKWSDGWVEQGGKASVPGTGSVRCTLPVKMYDTNYDVQITGYSTTGMTQDTFWCTSKNISYIDIDLESAENTGDCSWEVKGMAA